MKKRIILGILIVGALGLAGCPSKNSPSSPPSSTGSGPTPTVTSASTPSAPSQSATLSAAFIPYDIRYASGGYLWITDQTHNDLLEVTTAGAAVTTISSFNGGNNFSSPTRLGIDPSTGNVHVANVFHYVVDIFSGSGSYLTSMGAAQLGSTRIGGLAVNAAGTTLYMGNYDSGAILVYSITAGSPPAYTYQTSFGNSGPQSLTHPEGEAIDSQGNLWVADYNTNRLVEFNAAGTYQEAVTLATGSNAYDVAVDGSGNLFASDPTHEEIQEFNAAGQPLYQFKGSLSSVWGICLDNTNTYLYVADSGSSVIGVFKVH